MSPDSTTDKRRRKFQTQTIILLRRIHLYAGLFLLPWVFLYGITGAMYNHYGLLPEASIQNISADQLQDSSLQQIPEPVAFAKQVVEALQSAAPDSSIQFIEEHQPEFANEIIVEIKDGEKKYDVHIDPVQKSSWIASHTGKRETLEPVLSGISNLQLKPNPYEAARAAIPDILHEAGIETNGTPKPIGWSKLNFLANIDGQPARITYVLRDGHVNITRHTGQDGMTLRQFFLRMHTTHGQPPHWNGRRWWSLIVDAMAIAMVSWGLTGLVMWWQIKRTRWIGGIVLLCSLATAAFLYFGLVHFYATTKL